MENIPHHTILIAAELISLILFFGFYGFVFLRLALSKDAILGLIGAGAKRSSFSRFQFIVFTFIIGTGFLMHILDKHTFPTAQNWSPNLLVLLGLSTAAYAAPKVAEKLKGSGKTDEDDAYAEQPQ